MRGVPTPMTDEQRARVQQIAENRANDPGDKALSFELKCSRATIQKMMREWRARVRASSDTCAMKS